MTCPNCGASNPEYRRTCAYCGTVLDRPALTPEEEFTVMGRAAQRVDAVERVTGRAQYTQDVIVPGMLFATVLRRPSYGASLIDIDTSVAERMPGVVQVARVRQGRLQGRVRRRQDHRLRAGPQEGAAHVRQLLAAPAHGTAPRAAAGEDHHSPRRRHE